MDIQDACPETPQGSVVNSYGCPVSPLPVEPAPVVEPAPAVEPAPPVDPAPPAVDLPEPAQTFYLEYLPNEVEVSADFTAELQRMADLIRTNPGQRFIIEGHTDSVGSDSFNMKLSLLRAEKIKAYLAGKMEIPATLLEARGFGESNPVAGNDTQEGRRQNRRVVIIVLPQ